ncbi:MAG: MarR family transcriptional regulator [Candidatus Binatia bacterium]|nr:MarR family transcriptional regulator [Candidatus Binatia bacterium]
MSSKAVALELVLTVFRLANVWGQVGNRLAGAYGLTAQQWLALTSIAVGGEEGITPTEVGKSALVSPQNVTGLLDRLERSGYVERKPVGDDRRSYRVRLTAMGKKVFLALNPVGAAWAQRAVRELPAEKVAVLHELLSAYLVAATKVAFLDGHPRKSILPARSRLRAGQRSRSGIAQLKRAAESAQPLATEP